MTTKHNLTRLIIAREKVRLGNMHDQKQENYKNKLLYLVNTTKNVTKAPFNTMQIFGHKLLTWRLLPHILISIANSSLLSRTFKAQII